MTRGQLLECVHDKPEVRRSYPTLPNFLNGIKNLAQNEYHIYIYIYIYIYILDRQIERQIDRQIYRYKFDIECPESNEQKNESNEPEKIGYYSINKNRYYRVTSRMSNLNV